MDCKCTRIVGRITPGASINGSLHGSASIHGELSIRGSHSAPYDGSYEVVPSEDLQTLGTQRRVLANDIVIHPIPSNYGRIDWDGSVLTVY